jgi:hypothetical protein
MALEGDLRVFRLPDILQVISQQQKTGILTVQGDQDILAVSFLRGDIVAADALNQNFETGLGEVLASQGLVRPESLSRLFDEQKTSGLRLADFLVERGALSKDQLLEALRQLTYRLLLQVLRWRQGEFKFYSGEEVSYEEGFISLPVAEVLMRSLGDLMGEGTLSGTLPHGFVAYERIPVSHPVKVIGIDGTPPAEAGDEQWVSADEHLLLGELDGVRTADAIAKKTGLGEYKTLFGLFRLLQSGLVRPAGSEPEEAGAPEVDEPKPVSRPAPRRASPGEIELPVEAVGLAREVWTARLLATSAALLVIVLFVLVAWRPSGLLLPFPWLREERAAFDRQQRVARSLVIDRAARTHFLLQGRYPDRLGELVERGLLSERHLFDPGRQRYGYQADAISYVLESPTLPTPHQPAAVSETISGDFVVDPEFFHGLRENEGIPLILLD